VQRDLDLHLFCGLTRNVEHFAEAPEAICGSPVESEALDLEGHRRGRRDNSGLALAVSGRDHDLLADPKPARVRDSVNVLDVLD
jgi:hypothetical protein